MKEQYIISENVDHQIKVLQLLERLGYLWQLDKKPTELVPLEERADNKVIYMELDTKTLSYCDLEYLEHLEEVYWKKKQKNEEITYEELLRQNKKVIL